MVMLKQESAKEFPKFDRYLREEFFHVQTKARVMDAFFKWCAWPKSDPKKYTYSHFFYGTNPSIEIASESENTGLCDLNPQRTKLLGIKLALTTSSGLIVLNRGLVNLVEEAMGRAAARQKASDDDFIFTLIEAVIMHEMVHWSYFWEDVDEKAKYGGDEEYGTTRFEQEAYGRRLRTTEALEKHICAVRPAAPYWGIDWDLFGTITVVTPGSPAARAGLTKGDRFRKFNGQSLGEDGAGAFLRELFFLKNPGDRVTVEVQRSEGPGRNRAVTAQITLGATTGD